jgi:hypothetical protein
MRTQHGPLHVTGRRMTALVAEFVLIVAGVLVALALDQWRGRLQDSALEQAYVARLRSDLARDTAAFRWFGEILDTKDEVLHQLLLPPAEQAWNGAPAEQLSRLRYSTFFGLPPITTATFNELLSTGKVNLLRSGELRGELASYYAFYTRLTAILDVLPGSYRAIVWASLPGDAEHRARRDAAAADTATVRLGLARLGGNPQLHDAVNHELYYSAGLREYLAVAQQRALTLLRTLDDLYGEPAAAPAGNRR